MAIKPAVKMKECRKGRTSEGTVEGGKRGHIHRWGCKGERDKGGVVTLGSQDYVVFRKERRETTL